MNKSLLVTLIGLTSVAGTLAGCGSGSGDGCGKVEPCGGAIVGSWKIIDSCVNSSTVTPSNTSFCPQATVDASGEKITGTATYNADLTYAVSASVSASVKLGFPPACLTSGGITLTCAQLNSGVQAQLAANPDPTIQSYTCAGAGSTCECTVVLVAQTLSESGTYTTAGNVLTSTPTGGVVSNDSYCVQGSTLHMVSIDTTMNMGPMGQATITQDVVLSKQ